QRFPAEFFLGLTVECLCRAASLWAPDLFPWPSSSMFQSPATAEQPLTSVETWNSRSSFFKLHRLNFVLMRPRAQTHTHTGNHKYTTSRDTLASQSGSAVSRVAREPSRARDGTGDR
ncbi:unnamed protein product, partial [Pleuronectes platessa]